MTLGGVLLAGTSSGASQATPGAVTVVHALRGLVADVYLDGAIVLQTFQPERSTDALRVPAGPHTVDVRVSGSPATSTPALSGTLDVPTGGRLSAVIHLTADGQPTMTAYTDSLTPVPAGQARVIVRHVAAAPAVDVAVDQSQVAAALANPTEGEADVPAGTREVRTTAAGAANLVAAPQRVPLAEGTANFMYLLGSQAEGTVGWIAVQAAGLVTPPAGVPTGNSGLAAHSDGNGSPTAGLAAGGLAVMGALVVRARRRGAPVG